MAVQSLYLKSFGKPNFTRFKDDMRRGNDESKAIYRQKVAVKQFKNSGYSLSNSSSKLKYTSKSSLYEDLLDSSYVHFKPKLPQIISVTRNFKNDCNEVESEIIEDEMPTRPAVSPDMVGT